MKKKTLIKTYSSLHLGNKTVTTTHYSVFILCFFFCISASLYLSDNVSNRNDISKWGDQQRQRERTNKENRKTKQETKKQL